MTKTDRPTVRGIWFEIARELLPCLRLFYERMNFVLERIYISRPTLAAMFICTRTYQKKKRVVRIRRVLALSTLIICISVHGHFSPAYQAQSVGDSRVYVRLVTDEAEAVLAILSKRKANQALT